MVERLTITAGDSCLIISLQIYLLIQTLKNRTKPAEKKEFIFFYFETNFLEVEEKKKKKKDIDVINIWV